MKRVLHILVPLLLVVALVASCCWYLMIYDKEFTRDIILQQAHVQESNGNRKTANWLYNLAYRQSRKEGNVAIELANFFIAAGNYTKAEYTLTNAIADGGDSSLYIALCSTYIAQGKYLDAIDMLEHISNPEILAEVSALRPAAPTLSPEPGFYSAYIDVEVSSEGNTVYADAAGMYPRKGEGLYTEPISLPQGESQILSFAIGENGLISPLTVGSYTIGGVVEPIELTDASLDEQLRKMLGKSSSSPIYTNDVWDITELEIPDSFSAWQDLRYFTGLTTLSIHNTTLPTLSFLTDLAKLQTLDLSSCIFPVEELTYLSHCPNLEKLNLQSCSLSTISGLEAAATLRQLDLSGNTIRNLSPLVGITSLETLNLAHNAVSDLDALSSLTNLTELDLSYNDLLLITPLSALSQLQILRLGHNEIQSLSPITSLTELVTLECGSNQVVSLSPLSGCSNLRTLDVSENLISDLSPLPETIQNLDFSYNMVEALPKWTSTCALVTVSGAYNRLTNINSLFGLTDLNSVVLDYNEIEDVSGLADCPRLISVDVFGTKVTDVKALLDMDVVVHYDPTYGQPIPDNE